jgi:hypothetical protein
MGKSYKKSPEQLEIERSRRNSIRKAERRRQKPIQINYDTSVEDADPYDQYDLDEEEYEKFSNKKH